jgi:hypothetical protein
MKSQWYTNIALFFLVVHLFVIQSKLLYHLNPDTLIANSEVFNFTPFGVENIVATIISISYAVMTIIVIKAICLPFAKIWKFLLILCFACIDGVGVWLYYAVLNDYRIWASLYYGFNTFAIIAAFGLNQSYIGAKSKIIGADEDLRNKILDRGKYLNKSHLNVYEA